MNDKAGHIFRDRSTGYGAYSLTVEGMRTPLGVDSAAPVFRWRYGPNAITGTSARVLLWQDATSALIWDSGPLGLAATATYAGESLTSLTRYRWRVEVEGELAGHEPLAVANSWFETGLGDVSRTGGSWISRDTRRTPQTDPPDMGEMGWRQGLLPSPAIFRKNFDIRSAVLSARLCITAHGVYRARINGERAGADELSPGWTDYGDRVSYQVYDVSDSVVLGTNQLDVELGDGWWSGYIGFDSRKPAYHYGLVPEMWAVLVIDTDVGRTLLRTDATWTYSTGTTVYSDLLLGEFVDLTRTPSEDSWLPAIIAHNDLSSIVPTDDTPIRVLDRITSVSASPNAEGAMIYDFGQNLVGHARVTVSVPEPSLLRLRFAEAILGAGIYRDNLRAADSTDWFKVDAGSHTLETTFALHGFRFLELSGIAVYPLPVDVVAVVVGNEIPRTGWIETSHSGINQLLSNIVWSARGNFVGVPTDCPQRDERLGWLADAQVFLPTAAFFGDVRSFFRRWLRDVRSAQGTDGSFADVAPVVSSFFLDGAPGWGDAGVIIPWELYRRYGDLDLLRESYNSMRQWVDLIWLENPDLIWRNRVGHSYGDWLNVDQVTPREVVATAFFAHSADLLARSAVALGNTVEADRYRALAADIAQGFQSEFISDDGTILGDTQTGYVLALAFGLAGASAPDVAERLIDALAAREWHVASGFIGAGLLCEVLTSIGRTDLSYLLLEQEDYPSWLYPVGQGATTVWERWDGIQPGGQFQSWEMNSLNHYAFGAIGNWMATTMLGIDQSPHSIGYAELLLRPEPGGSLTSASGVFESPRGRVEVGWFVRGDRIEFDVAIPPGAPATFVVPPRVAELTVEGAASDLGGTFSLGPGKHRLVGEWLAS